MSNEWKVATERVLMAYDSPAVLSTAMLQSIADTQTGERPSRRSFMRWMSDMVRAEKLREVIRGVYLNVLGHRDVSPAAAAHWIRSRSVVSLSWVLEQAHITNNFGDTVTCVIPTHPSWPSPQISDRKTAAAPFRFFAMPVHLVDEAAGALEDIRDFRFDYPRTTPEKAFLDWVYLGASHRSRMTRPPFDLDIESLDMGRIDRLAASMKMEPLLETWLASYRLYQDDEDVRENAATKLRF